MVTNRRGAIATLTDVHSQIRGTTLAGKPIVILETLISNQLQW